MNGLVLTLVILLPCTDGTGDVSSYGTVPVTVPVFPMVLDWDPDIFLIYWIYDSFRRVPFNYFLIRFSRYPCLVQLNFVSLCE